MAFGSALRVVVDPRKWFSRGDTATVTYGRHYRSLAPSELPAHHKALGNVTPSDLTSSTLDGISRVPICPN